MKIILDENAGFCFGVKRAVDRVFEEIGKTKDRKLYTYGPLIHNKQVIARLESLGASSIEDIGRIKEPEAAELIIRSHGIPEEKYRLFEEMGLKYIDCTCPYVSAIHKKVREYYQKGYKIIIVGDRNHPEVIGINGWCGNTAEIVDNEKTVDKLPIYD
ncbi:MAG TPA: 4-hydroxy-3-methylbut-2-enyl diphosphate reductase, partial [Clostridia bacterium]|nr:4-hydroxy-3-methylbut-2-enyl diphosphate reductase [Clostridia bacterium]